jgi:hypothetical protein
VDTKANPVAGKITSTASNTLIQQGQNRVRSRRGGGCFLTYFEAAGVFFAPLRNRTIEPGLTQESTRLAIW